MCPKKKKLLNHNREVKVFFSENILSIEQKQHKKLSYKHRLLAQRKKVRGRNATLHELLKQRWAATRHSPVVRTTPSSSGWTQTAGSDTPKSCCAANVHIKRCKIPKVRVLFTSPENKGQEEKISVASGHPQRGDVRLDQSIRAPLCHTPHHRLVNDVIR